MNWIKKFLNEFKDFALKGNVMDLAVGVIIGAAFKDIVTSLTENFINPVLNFLTGATGWRFYTWQKLPPGSFLLSQRCLHKLAYLKTSWLE